MHRRILSTVVGLMACLSLVSCGGSGGTVCTQQYWNGSVGVCLPDAWKVVERERFQQLSLPPEVEAAFQAEDPVSGLYPTAVITREILMLPTDSIAYSRANVQAVSILPGYEQLDKRTVTVDGKEVEQHVYTAQPEADQPKSRFYQVSAVSGSGTGYTVTVSLPFSVSEALDRQALAISQSLTTVEPKE